MTGPTVRLAGILAAITAAGTVALGLSLPATAEQGTYSRLIAIHPPAAWASYLAFGVTALTSALYLWPRTRRPRFDHVAAASAEIGVVFTAVTLATGSIWGRPTWGTWWEWDARLTATAVMFVLYLGYLALRRVTVEPDVRARRSAVVALLAVAIVPINHMAVEWWRTLHQGRSLVQPDPGSQLDGDFVAAMLLGFVAMTLLYGWLLAVRTRIEALGADADATAVDDAIAARRAERAGVAR